MTGVAAISAGFVTYMGPYPYMFRRMLLTVDWAQCLAERGIPLVFDTIDPVNGHQVEFMLDVNGKCECGKHVFDSCVQFSVLLSWLLEFLHGCNYTSDMIYYLYNRKHSRNIGR